MIRDETQVPEILSDWSNYLSVERQSQKVVVIGDRVCIIMNTSLQKCSDAITSDTFISC